MRYNNFSRLVTVLAIVAICIGTFSIYRLAQKNDYKENSCIENTSGMYFTGFERHLLFIR